ncbi:hypothetical protein M3J09_013499 [Ascochyta lentis]
MSELLSIPSTEERDRSSRDVEAGPRNTTIELTDQPTVDFDQEQTGAVPRQNRWTRVHSHFALMGGYTISPGLGPSQARRTLKPAALRAIASNLPDLLPDFSEDDIQDKSKASQFAKLLVCLQAAWFSINLIGRLATDNPISLLELNTFLHAICCLAIYMAWWNKPLDIEKPFVIDASRGRMQKVRAWMNLLSQSRLRAWKHHDPSPDVTSYAQNRWWYLIYVGAQRDLNPHLQGHAAREKLTHTEDGHEGDEYWYKAIYIGPGVEAAQRNEEFSSQRAILRLYVDQTYHGFRLGGQRFRHTVAHEEYPDIYTTLSPGTLKNMRLIHSLKQGGNSEKNWPLHFHGDHSMCSTSATLWKPQDKILEWDTDFWVYQKRKNLDSLFIACLLAAGSLYGGVHLLAWNGPFASLKEQWVWRISCIIIAGPGMLSPLHWVQEKIFDLLDDCSSAPVRWAAQMCVKDNERRTRVESQIESTVVYCIFGVLLIFMLTYVAARVYIIVECFINLAHLPPEVYIEPAWSRYIPHFGVG